MKTADLTIKKHTAIGWLRGTWTVTCKICAQKYPGCLTWKWALTVALTHKHTPC